MVDGNKGTGLVDRILDDDNILQAYEEVRRRDLADGIPSRSLLRFSAAAVDELGSLAASLADRSFRPGPLQRVSIKRPDGRLRHLSVPPFRDRVAERAVGRVLIHDIDPALSPRSFAYRPGLGVQDAVRFVAEARNEGASWVARTDIDDCFDSIPHESLERELAARLPDDWLQWLVGILIRRPVRDRRVLRRRSRGTPQGAPLSPILTNVYLDHFDDSMLARRWNVVRFADDITVFCSTRSEAEDAITDVQEVLDGLGFRLNEEKTIVASFEGGFQFLGVEFGPRFPLATETRRVGQRKSIYVTAQRAWVGLSRGQVTVRRGDETLASVPRAHVSQLVLFGEVSMSSWFRSEALRSKIDVVFLSRRGGYMGRLLGPDGGRIELLRHQMASADDETRALDLAASFVKGKIANMRALLQRRGRGGHDLADAVARLAWMRMRADQAESVESLLGMEGTATATYFGAIRGLLPDELGFDARRRRPPPDPVNSALSLGYSILTDVGVGACVSAGLDPHVGFLHRVQSRQPSLALDLIEEFRPLIVDTVVIEAFRRGSLGLDDFRFEDTRGCRFTNEALKGYLGALEERMLTLFAHVPSGTRRTYRQALFLQARTLTDYVLGLTERYEPVRWR